MLLVAIAALATHLQMFLLLSCVDQQANRRQTKKFFLFPRASAPSAGVHKTRDGISKAAKKEKKERQLRDESNQQKHQKSIATVFLQSSSLRMRSAVLLEINVHDQSAASENLPMNALRA